MDYKSCRGSFLTGKAAWVLNGCLRNENADYCIMVNEVTSLYIVARSAVVKFWSQSSHRSQGIKC